MKTAESKEAYDTANQDCIEFMTDVLRKKFEFFDPLFISVRASLLHGCFFSLSVSI